MKTFYFNQDGEFNSQKDLVKGSIVFEAKAANPSRAKAQFRRFIHLLTEEVRESHEKAIEDSPGAGTQDDIDW